MYTTRSLREFLQTEVGGAVVLATATVAALVLANSPVADGFLDLLHRELTLGVGDLAITEDVQHWINDGLMAIFFFVVGLEIKRELVVGELRDPRAAALPAIAALGGIVVPAGIYLAINAGEPTASGWGVPVATDIAFVLGVLALVGRRLPSSLRLFMLTLAIVDDLGAILIIAIAYTDELDTGWLAVAAFTIIVILAMRRRAGSPWAYLVPALVLWVATLESGIHATLAGVVLGLLTPAGPVRGRPVLEDLEHRLHPLSSFVVLPLFALANAGVALDAAAVTEAISSRAAQGIVAGLLVGKTVGIGVAVVLALRFGIARLPDGVRLAHLVAVAPLGGIGFTVSLFVAGLSFGGADLDAAKVGVLVGSIVSGVAGVLALRAVRRRGETRAAAVP